MGPHIPTSVHTLPSVHPKYKISVGGGHISPGAYQLWVDETNASVLSTITLTS